MARTLPPDVTGAPKATPLPSLLSSLLLIAGCQWSVGGGPDCLPMGDGVPLPDDLDESSGVTVSVLHPGVFWSHNDSGSPPVIFAVDRDGRILARVGLAGANNRDWEDIATAPCTDGGQCLYIADVGDNRKRRKHQVLYRLREPDTLADTVLPAERFPFSLPDGPRDMEAIFVLEGERVYFITKGAGEPVEVYRYPGPLDTGRTVVLERVQFLSNTPRILPNQVTGASASPDGRTVAVRTYSTLRFYGMDKGRLVVRDNGLVNLRSLNETQGEGVGLGPDGLVVLTSEAGPVSAGPGGMRLLRCEVE